MVSELLLLLLAEVDRSIAASLTALWLSGLFVCWLTGWLAGWLAVGLLCFGICCFCCLSSPRVVGCWFGGLAAASKPAIPVLICGELCCLLSSSL